MDCSYIAYGQGPCYFGACDPQRGCVLEVYPASTPCDANGDYCDIERCNSVGECINYNGRVSCPAGLVCDPQHGTCHVPVSATGTASPSASSVPSISVSGTQNLAPASSSPSAPPAGISQSASASASKTGSHTRTPTPFPHFSVSMTPVPSFGIDRSVTPSKTPSNTPATNLVPSKSAAHQGDTGMKKTLWIVIPTVTACCLLVVCLALVVIAAAVSATQFDDCTVRILDPLLACFRRVRGTGLHVYKMTPSSGDPDNINLVDKVAPEPEPSTLSAAGDIELKEI